VPLGRRRPAGTLNLIREKHRVAAARLVTVGRTVSCARDILTTFGAHAAGVDLTTTWLLASSRLTFLQMGRLRYAARLGGEFVAYSVVNRAWWVVPMVLLLAVVALAIVVGQAAAPYTLYTLF
jgi:hypothetical protein